MKDMIPRFSIWRREEFETATADERADRAWPKPRTPLVATLRLFQETSDVGEAAEIYADFCHANRDGWEWSWPQEFVVFDQSAYWVVSVDRETVPEFNAATPQPLKVT